jgi:hypothetical protein
MSMEKKRKSTTLRLTEQDIQAVLKIRQVYGIASDNQAIIFALHATVKHMEEPHAAKETEEQERSRHGGQP